MQKEILVGVDTGGTFTDFVVLNSTDHSWRVHKVLSTPAAPQQAILRGLTELGIMEAVIEGRVGVVHGTTVATNAALEGKGARTAYITNTGMKDVLRIGRQTRSELYSLSPSKDEVPVDPELLFEVNARVDATGHVLASPDSAELEALAKRIDASNVQSIAINLLFSYLNSEHEIAIEAMLSEKYFVSRSSEILPEYKEYERGATTWVNSWLGPRIAEYMQALQLDLTPAPIAIMQSSGLTIAAELAARRAVNLLLSGPAGGLAAAKYIGDKTQRQKLLTFDMGGTSTDVALIDGQIALTNEGKIAGIPIGIPMADIHTIGAGGGSIAFVDAGGLLKVGPESAGADPGPACYGRGGTRPTVTDANLVLGRLPHNAKLADGLHLDVAAATVALGRLAHDLGQGLEETARGVIAIANEHMVQALRVISIQRGHDPRGFNLVCFGGAGGLHVCDVAEALQMQEILVPIHSGVLSALGMLTTQPGRELVKTAQSLLSDTNHQQISSLLDNLAQRGRDELAAEGVMQLSRKDSLDIRYQGQTAALNIEYDGDLIQVAEAFQTTHKSQFGHQLERPIELVNCRVHLEGTDALPAVPLLDTEALQEPLEDGVIQRHSCPINHSFNGPALVLDDHSTIRIAAGWSFSVDAQGHLWIKKT